MSDLPKNLIKQFHSFVALCNPANIRHIHPADEKRLTAFFFAVDEAGFDVSHNLICQIWPTSTTPALGGDPAEVTELKAMVSEKAECWPNAVGGGN